jgi:transcriptional regulator of aromatic amino acid metabolism
MLNSAYNIITESVKAETSVVENATDSYVIDELMNEVESCRTVPESVMEFTPEMVTVIESKGNYFMEIENVARLAKDQNMSISEAVFTVANANSINADNCFVVIESNASIRNFIEENTAPKQRKSRAASSMLSAINDLKQNNIKIVKSKSF